MPSQAQHPKSSTALRLQAAGGHNRTVMKRIPAAEFKATCLELMDRVARTGEPVEVTRRGKPVVRLVPAVPSVRGRSSIFGAARESFTFLAPDEDLLSTGARWHASR